MALLHYSSRGNPCTNLILSLHIYRRICIKHPATAGEPRRSFYLVTVSTEVSGGAHPIQRTVLSSELHLSFPGENISCWPTHFSQPLPAHSFKEVNTPPPTYNPWGYKTQFWSSAPRWGYKWGCHFPLGGGGWMFGGWAWGL